MGKLYYAGQIYKLFAKFNRSVICLFYSVVQLFFIDLFTELIGL